MRLIDADVLYTSLVKMKGYGELTAKKAIRCIEKAHTADAIPIDWMMCKRNEHNNDGFAWIYEAVMDDWRRENEIN